ncbi:POL5 [Candida pseudojiufengensis]|uniref:POL5 n=1 Tax=Candida pseudojiufengensis TaxID=497109 RepID=UPI002224AECA|nr:POL5 [Candida pseudojiufengensis]KAI5965362.1 POL5 [Candida pseudojiufengensis]
MVQRELFSKLASEDGKERVSSANKLIKQLLEENSQEEWDYTYNRLIKGLISTKQSAKLGFSMVLTEVLLQLFKQEKLDIIEYLNKLNEVTTIKSNMKGKEERAVLFGRLFGFNVLLNAINISKLKENEISIFIDKICELLNTKPWIREVATASLIQIIENFKSPSFQDSNVLKILQNINNLGLNLSLEGLAIYLKIPKYKRNELSKKIQNPKSNWKNGDPLNKGNLPILSKVLKDINVVDDGEENSRKQNSNWNPKLPFVWDLIVENFGTLVTIDDEEPPKKKQKGNNKKNKNGDIFDSIGLKEFYKVVIDESFFSEKSSHERKYWGFEIFNKFLTHLYTEIDIDYLFTPNFMRCLINQSSHKSRYLHDIARITLKIIIKKCKEVPEVSWVIFRNLLNESKGGCWNFDLITKTRTIDEIITIPNYQNLETLINEFNQFLSTQTKSDGFKYSNDNILKWYLDKLVTALKYNKKDNNILVILDMLIEYSFFESDLSPNLRKLCQEKLNSTLSDLLAGDDYFWWPSYCARRITELENSKTCIIELDEELTENKQEILKIFELLKSEESEIFQIFKLLFSMCFIQLYIGDEDIISITQDLISLYETFKTNASDKDIPIAITEIILSYISKKNVLLKKLAIIVWEKFLCKPINEDNDELRINDECFESLFRILVAKENKEGQKSLFENDDEMELDEEEEDDDDNDRAGDSEEAEEDEEEDEEDEEDDEEEEEEEVNNTMTDLDKETNLKLAEALGIPTKETGEVKFDELSDYNDSSNDEYESDSMDDEQMMAMDDQLSKIFKERQDILNESTKNSGNKRQKEVMEAKENMIFFKNRILDLLEVFNKVNPNSEYNLKFIEPIITLVNLTLDKNLGLKAHKFLKTKISKTKISPSSIKNKEQFINFAMDLIKNLQLQANSTKSTNQSVYACYNQSCIILAKNILILDSSKLNEVIDIYATSMKNWATSSSSKIQPSLFFDFINWLNDKRK